MSRENDGSQQGAKVRAVVFDLDGVIVSTDQFHYRAWSRLAEQEGIPFAWEDNDRLRGVSRMESLDILLEKASREYSLREKREMAERKNGYYRQALESELTPRDVLPGVREFMDGLRSAGIKLAVGSSSRNTPMILEKIGLQNYFEAVADGNDIARSKPDPQVFLIAAERLRVAPEECLVIEDAEAGVAAAVAANMRVLAVGAAADDQRADMRARALAEVDWRSLPIRQ